MGLINNGVYVARIEGDGKYVTVQCKEHKKDGTLLVGSRDGKTLHPTIFCEACGLKTPPKAPIASWDSFEEMEKELAAIKAKYP